MSIDILMITFNRPRYTDLALSRLLQTCDESMRVWIWHNGDHAETLEVVRSFLEDPRVHRFRHSVTNEGLWAPTTWLWTEAEGELVSKVDDDCLVEPGWAQRLAAAHGDVPRLGVVGSWRYLDDEFEPELAAAKMRDLPGGHRILANLWVQGSGYLMKRECIEDQGSLRPGQGFTEYCIDLAERGWVNGWYVPFVREEHMDDPRSAHTCLHSDDDLLRNLPLSAQRNGVRTLAQWEAQLRRSAHIAQSASLDVRSYRGWRRKLRGAQLRLRRLVGIRRQW